MLQIDNLNKIKWFRDMFLEFKDYDIDVSSYCDELSLCIEKYENHKNREEENREALLSINGNSEMQLSVDLSELEFDFRSHILFLDLMHATKTWDYHENIDEVFNSLHGVVDHKLVEKFSSISTQELIVHKYYDLVFKKIMREYNKENYEYLEQYRHLEKYPYLRDSITHYLEKHYPRLLDEPIELEKVLQNIVCDDYTDIEVVDNHEEVVEVSKPFMIRVKEHFKTRKMVREATEEFVIQRKFKDRMDFEGEDLSLVCFDKMSVKDLNLRGTNAHINPQKVQAKSLFHCNLEGLDLSSVDFSDVDIRYASLKETGAKINPKCVHGNLIGCNLEGLDLSDVSFVNTIIQFANLKNTNASIDPQLVHGRSFWGTNVEGLDLAGYDFGGVDIRCANLTNTSAHIYLNLNHYNYRLFDGGTSLTGCYVYLDASVASKVSHCVIEGATILSSYQEFMMRREEAEKARKKSDAEKITLQKKKFG